MTKSQLIEQIGQRLSQVPRHKVEAIINTVFDLMVEALGRDERIEIRGFGSFAVKSRDAREGRNPKTGAKVRVPRRRTPYFTVGKELRDRLNPDAPAPQGPSASPQPVAYETAPAEPMVAAAPRPL